MEKFNDEIRHAIESYPRPQPSRDFDARVLQTLLEKRHRRGFRATLLRFWQLEIEGVAVWRLAFSSLGGAAFCALCLGITLAISSEKPLQKLAQTPEKSDFPTENLGLLLARETEFQPRKPRELTAEKSVRPPMPSLRVFPFLGAPRKEVSCVSPRNWA